MTAPARYAGPNRRRATHSSLWIGLALLSVAGVAYVTLCPIGLRPHLASANFERAGAYLVVGALISMAGGRRRLEALAMILIVAFGLEAAQALVPGRHPAAADAIVKALGGVIGSVVGQLAFPARRLATRTWDRALGALIGPSARLS